MFVSLSFIKELKKFVVEMVSGHYHRLFFAGLQRGELEATV